MGTDNFETEIKLIVTIRASFIILGMEAGALLRITVHGQQFETAEVLPSLFMHALIRTAHVTSDLIRTAHVTSDLI
jgi:hypothetical protein